MNRSIGRIVQSLRLLGPASACRVAWLAESMAGYSALSGAQHEHRKETVATSPTQFVSLSACDEDMVQQCDEAHYRQAELNLCKRKQHAAYSETNLHQNQRNMPLCTPPSEHLSSEGELNEFELGHTQLLTKSDPVQESEESSLINESQAGGRKKALRSEFSSVGERRADGGRVGDSLGISRSNGASPYPSGSSTFVAPRVRFLRPVNGTIQSPDVCPPSSTAAQCSRGPSRTGSFGELSSLSLSGQSVLRTTTETPPGVANAFEAHEMRVRCLAPKRPKARTVQGRHHDAHPLALSFAAIDQSHDTRS